ncbi:hypothetical protein C8Q72DRAFT_275519 [Fomitopsis betulina]|nr:hypothetical protein C8Q72DRAFT_275519 [Fomitopsis betulina]
MPFAPAACFPLSWPAPAPFILWASRHLSSFVLAAVPCRTHCARALPLKRSSCSAHVSSAGPRRTATIRAPADVISRVSRSTHEGGVSGSEGGCGVRGGGHLETLECGALRGHSLHYRWRATRGIPSNARSCRARAV